MGSKSNLWKNFELKVSLKVDYKTMLYLYLNLVLRNLREI